MTTKLNPDKPDGGETRGTCDGYLRHAPHTEAEHKSNCLKPGLPRWEWKPLAPEAPTRESVICDMNKIKHPLHSHSDGDTGEDKYCVNPRVAPEATTKEPDGRLSAESLAKFFHDTYEQLAPDFGYETRKESAKPWADVPDKNKRLMIAVCAEVITELSAVARPKESVKIVGWHVAPGEAVGRETRRNPTEWVRTAASKLESQLSRDPGLPKFYWEVVDKAFDEIRQIETALKNLCSVHLEGNLIATGPCPYCELSTLRRERDQLKAECQPHFAMRVDLSAEFAAKMARLESQVRELTAQRDHWQKTYENLEKVAGELRINFENLQDIKGLQISKDRGEVWYWQGDGHDFPESLTCPVIMKAETVRELRAAVEKLTGELKLEKEKHHART